MSTTAPDMMRPREAAQRIGVSVATVRRRVADGSLPSKKLGGLVLIPRAAIERLTGSPL